MATAYGLRPSSFLTLETEIGAWALDEACLVTGRRFENMLNEGKNPFKDASTSPSAKQTYAPAPKRKIKTVKIKENGTW
jgi:hypothetical protein